MDTKPRLLVVDDNVELCCNLRDIFERNRCVVEYTHTGKDAIALFQRNRYDIALIDIKLPDVDGTEVVGEVTKFSSKTSFIYITGNATLDSAILATKEEHVASYETKPLDIDRLVFLINQIVERQHTQKKLDATEKRYRTLFEWSPTAILIIDPETSLPVEFNKAMLQLVSYTHEELLELPISKYISNLLPDKSDSYVDTIEQKSKNVFETRMYTKQGETKYVIVNMRHIDVAGKPFLHCIFVDFTKLKEVEDDQKCLETQILQLQRLEVIGTMTSGIAHDFNNILTPILGYGQLILAQIESKSQIAEYMRTLLQSAKRAQTLVDQILTFSRGVQNKPKSIFLNQIVKEVVKLLRATFPATINIQTHIDKKDLLVMVDPTHIHQIVVNLCTNAKDAMDTMKQGGILEVMLNSVDIDDTGFVNKSATFAKRPYALITIKDNGKGMCEKVTKQIFTPFFTTKRGKKGTGLGLSIVQRIVQSYDGKITVESQPEKGSKFHVYLPLSICNVELEDQNEEAILKGSENILFVDDDEVISCMGNLMLKDLGYNVTSSTNSREILEIFRKKPDKYDLIITDQIMPDITGDMLTIELLRIRSDIPIIIMTGDIGNSTTYESFKEIGIKDYITKPLDTKTLSKTIREILDKKT